MDIYIDLYANRYNAYAGNLLYYHYHNSKNNNININNYYINDYNKHCLSTKEKKNNN